MSIIVGILYFIFVLTCIFLILIILLQEGKGGGFGEAFGGLASETFGVKASGITRFTAILAAVFLGTAVFISMLQGRTGTVAAPGDMTQPAVEEEATGSSVLPTEGAGEAETVPPGESPGASEDTPPADASGGDETPPPDETGGGGDAGGGEGR
jgi:preprotein translocase subunit SecG